MVFYAIFSYAVLAKSRICGMRAFKSSASFWQHNKVILCFFFDFVKAKHFQKTLASVKTVCYNSKEKRFDRKGVSNLKAKLEVLDWKQNRAADNYMISYVNYGDAIAPHHWHREIEIIFMDKGVLNFGVNNEELQLPEGEFYIINSGDIHYFLPSPNSERIVIQLDLTIFSDLSYQKETHVELFKLFNQIRKSSSLWNDCLKRRMIDHLQAMHQEFTFKPDGHEIAIRAHLYEILLLLYREAPRLQEVSGNFSRQKHSVDYLKKVFLYVENNFQDEITLSSVASHIGFTTTYFTKFFKKHMGITFWKYLTHYRLNKVQWQLLNLDTSITEIAYDAGFTNLKTFNRVFKDELGLSPSEYRKRQYLRDFSGK